MALVIQSIFGDLWFLPFPAKNGLVLPTVQEVARVFLGLCQYLGGNQCQKKIAMVEK